MSSISERYDSNARDYVRYWAPVLSRAALRLLDDVEPFVRTAIARARSDGHRRPALMDLGAGTGVLTLAALARWPELQVIGADASSGMLAVIRGEAEHLPADVRRRLELVTAFADRLPSADASVDVCVSSFLFQLVPDRAAALRDVLRVLRPGGRVAFVTWIDEEVPFEAADVFDDVVVDLGFEDPDNEREEDVSGDFPSPEAADDELTAAGFDEVSARRDWLVYEWDPESYLDYKEHYGEIDLFASLAPVDRERLRDVARERLSVLDRRAFRWRTPIVYAFGRRPTS